MKIIRPAASSSLNVVGLYNYIHCKAHAHSVTFWYSWKQIDIRSVTRLPIKRPTPVPPYLRTDVVIVTVLSQSAISDTWTAHNRTRLRSELRILGPFDVTSRHVTRLFGRHIEPMKRNRCDNTYIMERSCICRPAYRIRVDTSRVESVDRYRLLLHRQVLHIFSTLLAARQ